MKISDIYEVAVAAYQKCGILVGAIEEEMNAIKEVKRSNIPSFEQMQKILGKNYKQPQITGSQIKQNVSSPLKEKDMLKLKMNGITVCEKQRADGRYQARWKREEGDTLYVYAKTFEELCKKMLDLLTGKTAIKGKTKTLAQWAQEWYEKYKFAKLKPKTRLSVERSIKYITDGLGQYVLKALTTAIVEEYILEIEQNRGNRTAILALGVLDQALFKAKKLKMIPENPCDDVEIDTLEGRHIKAFTRSETKQFLAACTGDTLEFLFVLLLKTGVRIGEALAITSADIDEANCKLTINKNVVFIKGKRVRQDTTKTAAGMRELPLTKKVLALYVAYHKTGELFRTLDDSAAQKAFKSVCAKAGLSGFSLNSLRHTFATRHAENRTPDKVLQYYMGHKSIVVTKRYYVHVNNEDFVNPYNQKIDEILDDDD